MTAAANLGAKLIAPVQPIDPVALGSWLRANVDAGIGDLVVEQYQGGQSNPTYRLTAGDRRYVLRRKPPGKLLPSAHAVDREFRVMSALAGTGVPVARMHALCEDDTVIGTAFYVMEYVEGRILWDPTLPGMTPPQRAAHYDELNRVIAALHRVDYAAIGLGDFGRTGSYIERQVARWSKQYQAAGADRIDAMDRLIEWLPAHIPDGDETSIVHGDYRLDNVIFHPTEPRILAVLDWELSTLGHPLSDFAYQVMAWRLSPQEFRGNQGRGSRGARHSFRVGLRGGVLPAHRPQAKSRTSSSTSSSTCSASPRSCTACSPARCRAMPPAPTPSRWAAAPSRWPTSHGGWRRISGMEHGVVRTRN